MNNADLAALDVAKLLKGIKAPTTVSAYALHWSAYVKFSGPVGPLHSGDTLAEWRRFLVQETQESPNTINLRLNSVKSIFRELAEQRRIPREMMWAICDVKPLKANALTARRNPTARVRIEPQEMRGLVETPTIRLGDPQGARDRALLMLMATSGVRVSEAIRVKVKDIQRGDQHYFIANIMGKAAAQARVAPLSAEAYAAIQDWLHVRPTHSEWVFTSISYADNGNLLFSTDPITRSAAYHTVKRVGAQFGMADIKPHDLRRFVGTQLARIDIRQAQRVLGHASIETTAKHYVLDEVPLGTTEGLF